MTRKYVPVFGALSIFFVQLFPFFPAMAAENPFVFGLLLVGPYNDHGYSQAHYDGGRYVEKTVPGTKMIYIDKVNPADRKGVTVPQLVDELVDKGAKLIIANSDDMKDGIREAALEHPQVSFVHVSGDDALTGNAPKNLANLFGRMEYGKMMAGFSAAMTSKTGKIGYLGPLENEETKRLANACYLGARYAWEKVRGQKASNLVFEVKWIGFWFNIPGVTADPTQVAQNFFNTGCDVVISGIDTTEALTVAGRQVRKGKQAWAIPYDYVGACGNEQVCLGVPYFNWGPGFVDFVEKCRNGRFTSEWIWLGPYWKDINDPTRTAVGFIEGPAMSPDVKKSLAAFCADLASGKLNLYQGPLNYQDGSVFVKKGQSATDKQIWYTHKLLAGMKGRSSAK